MRGAIVLALLVAPACLTQHALPPLEVEEKLEVVREKDLEGHVVREQMVLVRAGERPLPHGSDQGWFADGGRRFEREFARGVPRGTWRTWHPGGQIASEATFAGDGSDSTMRFWYASGVLGAEGPAREGSRFGRWRFWRPDGSLREEGEYVASLREGEWTVHTESGAIERLVYARGVLTDRQ